MCNNLFNKYLEYYLGSTVVWWLALLPQSKLLLGMNQLVNWEHFFAGFFWVLWFPPKDQRHADKINAILNCL